ncbi:MAG: rhomboid family intramembrane serine protease [Desulfobacterales bacterium]|jgi:membrane associated rhomboid family serine protease
MIPIRDTHPPRNRPLVNNLLIAANVLVFLLQLSQGSNDRIFIYLYGLVPARYSVPQIAEYFSIWQQMFSFFSFMFLHGGFFHLLGNMWFLYIFGDNVEDRLGPVRYLVFYLLCGLASGLSHLLLNLHSNVPTIGASGAIAGVMGAYFLIQPGARILTLVPVLFIPFFFEIPAYVFLGVWFLFQFLSAAGSGGAGGGIAWWAHIGGFVFGMIFLKIFQQVPTTGVSRKMRPILEKKTSHRLQVINPSGPGDDPHLYGILRITPFEASSGARKVVNIPWGFHKRLFQVTIPAGVQEGTQLRLAGLGKRLSDGRRGDLFLKIAIE